MTITEATWERRNFGMDAYEITLDKKDCENEAEILAQIRARNFKNAYVCVKMPVGNLKALHALEDEGFRFLEVQFFFTEHFEAKKFKENKHKITKKIIPKRKEKWEKIIAKITPGMFNADRISLDPKFSLEISCKRYQNWCRDLFENPNSYMIVGECDGEEYCFGVYVEDKKSQILDAVLVGIFEKFQNMGLSSTLLDKNLALNTTTSTSSNNLGAFKVYQKEGLIVCEEKYVLRKIY